MAMQIVIPTPPPPPPLLLPPTDHRSSLYVGDLHPDITDSDLLILFSMIGPIRSVRICRDRFSRKSLCYAYINFYFPSHAALALSRLNHTELRGKRMRIMWCQRDPFVRRTGIANLFVKNIDSSVSDARLEEVFGKFGTILSCKIAKDDQGKSKGFGFVQFDSEQSANNALNALDDTTLDGKIITVTQFLKKSDRKEPEFTNVYVKNLDTDFTDNHLRETFSKYGNVTSAVVMNDTNGKSRGFGFVNFESHDSAKKAIEALNGASIGSKKWFVGKAMTKSEREGFLRQKDNTNASNLFVRNLASSVDERNLEELFGAFGNIVLAKIIRYKNGDSKGFGFISFSNPDEAKKARDSLNGNLYQGKYMYVSMALSKEECTKKLQDRFASYYNFPSFVRNSVYDTYWQPNMYGSMQVLPSFKPQNPQESVYARYDKDQNLCMNRDGCFYKGPLVKGRHDVKKCGALWEMKRAELRKGLKGQADNGVGGDEGGSISSNSSNSSFVFV